MKNKIFKKIMLGVLSITLIFVAVLFVHIYMVSNKHQVNPNERQLSRIDFKQNINASEASKISAFVRSLPGVDATFFNAQDGILVYTYQLNKQNSMHVFAKLMAFGHYKAERYVVSADAAKSGCPAGMQNLGMMASINKYATQLFN